MVCYSKHKLKAKKLKVWELALNFSLYSFQLYLIYLKSCPGFT